MKRYPSGVLATCCVPWTEHYEFMEDLFREEVRMLLGQTRQVYIMGTAGEGYAVSRRQFEHIARAFADEVLSANAEPMVGLISLSASEVQERIDLCRDYGVTDFQISLPSWGVLSDDELYGFFELICGANQDCRFLHYNLPRAGRIVTAGEYVELAKRHPNLVATKNGTDSIVRITELMDTATELQHFITDLGFLHAATIGECGLLVAITSCHWPTVHSYFERASNGDYAGAFEIHRKITQVRRRMFEIAPRIDVIDGAWDKMYVKLRLPDFPLRLLPPYEGHSEETFSRFAAMLTEVAPDWLEP